MQEITEKQYKERVNVLVKWAKQGRDVREAELSKAEAEMYYALCNLYATYRIGGVSAEDGISRKAKIMKSFWETMSQHYAEQNARIESAANAYAKNRTLDNADRLYKALYGIEPNKKE